VPVNPQFGPVTSAFFFLHMTILAARNRTARIQVLKLKSIPIPTSHRVCTASLGSVLQIPVPLQRGIYTRAATVATARSLHHGRRVPTSFLGPRFQEQAVKREYSMASATSFFDFKTPDSTYLLFHIPCRFLPFLAWLWSLCRRTRRRKDALSYEDVTLEV
jgi:hypothetical protein